MRPCLARLRGGWTAWLTVDDEVRIVQSVAAVTDETGPPSSREASPADRIDYLYRDYVRLGDAIDAHLRGSFDDIKLLGGIAVLLAWPPIAQSNLFSDESSEPVLLVGFLGILFIVGILGVRDLMKQSVIRFYLWQLGFLERELRTELHSMAFSHAARWPRWEKDVQVPIIKTFGLLFIVLLAVFPNLVLGWQAELWYVAVYTVAFGFVAFAFQWASRILRSSASIYGSAELTQEAGAGEVS